MVDQRNHGSSALLRNLHPPHSIEAAAGDLTRLVDEEFQGRVPHSMLGHSLGGKTVLEFLRQRSSDGQQLPKQVSCSSQKPCEPENDGSCASHNV